MALSDKNRNDSITHFVVCKVSVIVQSKGLSSLKWINCPDVRCEHHPSAASREKPAYASKKKQKKKKKMSAKCLRISSVLCPNFPSSVEYKVIWNRHDPDYTSRIMCLHHLYYLFTLNLFLLVKVCRGQLTLI